MSETVTVPLEAWRHVLRRVRQLEVLHEQQGELLRSLVATVEASPADEAGETIDHTPAGDHHA